MNWGGRRRETERSLYEPAAGPHRGEGGMQIGVRAGPGKATGTSLKRRSNGGSRGAPAGSAQSKAPRFPPQLKKKKQKKNKKNQKAPDSTPARPAAR